MYKETIHRWLILSQLEIETSKGFNSAFNHLLTVLWKTEFGKSSFVLPVFFFLFVCLNEINYKKLKIVFFPFRVW